LSQQYEVCSTGTQESPVDLRDPVPAALGALELRYPEMPLRIVNNGHTIQVEAAPGGTLRLGGKDYELVQVHFHHPSEHLLAGRRFPMEAHLVHRGLDGGLAVVGVLIEEGARSEALAPVLDSAPPKEAAARTIAGATFQPGSLVPPEHGFLRYNGSLTTPPCTENVEWAVMAQPAQASRQQIEAFARLYPMNARPLQALNRRFLLQSHDVGEKTGGR
jgi:carbonic anhydrase